MFLRYPYLRVLILIPMFLHYVVLKETLFKLLTYEIFLFCQNYLSYTHSLWGVIYKE